MAIEVVKPGLATTVQDAGRPGYYNVGIPLSGALDQYALRVANLLVGNNEGAAVLEASLLAPGGGSGIPGLSARGFAPGSTCPANSAGRSVTTADAFGAGIGGMTPNMIGLRSTTYLCQARSALLRTFAGVIPVAAATSATVNAIN